MSRAWDLIRANIAEGQTLRIWAKRDGFGSPFTVRRITPTGVAVEVSSTHKIRRVSKQDIDSVADIWARYCSGAISRRAITRPDDGSGIVNVSYALGLIKSIEGSL